jgi:hypothetical protein
MPHSEMCCDGCSETPRSNTVRNACGTHDHTTARDAQQPAHKRACGSRPDWASRTRSRPSRKRSQRSRSALGAQASQS